MFKYNFPIISDEFSQQLSKNNTKRLVLFDFDGTLIEKDSIKLFCRYRSSNYLLFIFEYYFLARTFSIFSPIKTKFFLVDYFNKKKSIKNFKLDLSKYLFNDSIDLVKYFKKNNFDEKLNQVISKYPKSKIIYAFGNSKGDYSILNAATYSYYREKNGRLLKWDNLNIKDK